MKTSTITEASRGGISDLAASAEAGRSIPISRHGRETALVMARFTYRFRRTNRP